MLNQQKNKTMQKYRTEKDAITERYFIDKQDKDVGNSCIDTILQGNETVVVKNSENRSSRISSCLEKHIEYLQKKLSNAEAQTNKVKLYSEILETKLQEKYSENDRLLNKNNEQQKAVKQLSFKYQMLLSDHQNLKLKHKMEKLHRQINEQQETQSQIQLKNKQLKQGKYSASFMPSPFESPNKTFQQKTEKNQTLLENLSNPTLQKSMKSSPKQKNPINSYLLEEYQKLKYEKLKRQKQISQLKAQNISLKAQLDAKAKQLNKLVYERSNKSFWLNNELSKCKSKLQQEKQQNKMLFDKLKSTESKMIELSELVKNGQNIDQYKIREYSDMSDVRRILEDDKDKLLQESIITDPTLPKQEKDSQTDQMANAEPRETEKMQHYIAKIACLKSEMLQQTQQYNKAEQQYRSKLGSQLRRSNQLVEHYRAKAQKTTQDHRAEQKIQKLTSQAILDTQKSDNQVLQNCSNKQFKEMQVQCLLIASDILQERSYILEKAKIFIDFNDEQKTIIETLNQQNSQLQQLLQQHNHKNNTLQMEYNNFSNIYGQLRSNYEKLQVEFSAETQRLNGLLADKQVQIDHYQGQLDAATRQFHTLNQTLAQCQQRVSYYQKQIEKYQLKMEICNQQIDALRQNS